MKTLVIGIALASAHTAHAGTDIFFNPLTQSTAVATANHIDELNSPRQVRQASAKSI